MAEKSGMGFKSSRLPEKRTKKSIFDAGVKQDLDKLSHTNQSVSHKMKVNSKQLFPVTSIQRNCYCSYVSYQCPSIPGSFIKNSRPWSREGPG